MTVGAPKPTKDIVLDLFDFVWMQQAAHEVAHPTGEIGTIRDLYRQLEAERSLL